MSLDNIPFTLALVVAICVLTFYMSKHRCPKKTDASYAQSVYSSPAATINNVNAAQDAPEDVVTVAEKKEAPRAESIRDRVIRANRTNPLNYTQTTTDRTQLAYGF